MKSILKIFAGIVLLLMIPNIVQAEVLNDSWWSASRMDLHAARNQICEILDEPQTPFGTEIRGDVPIFSENWKSEGSEELHAALNQIDSFLTQMGDNLYELTGVATPTPILTPTPTPSPTPTPPPTPTPEPTPDPTFTPTPTPVPTPTPTLTPVPTAAPAPKEESVQEKDDSSGQNQFFVAPDGKKYVLQVGENGVPVFVPVIPNNALFIGNSLLLGFGQFGMCAPNAESDYYYYMTRCITEKNSEFTASRAFGVPLEKSNNDSEFDAAFENIAPKLTEDLDLVIVQLGENILEAVSYYENGGCVRLLTQIRQRCPNARVCWVASWYSTEQKQTMIKKACQETGCIFIETVDLRNEETSGKIGDVITYLDGNTSVVETSGVASHPGQKGMLAIARRICYRLGIIESEDEIQDNYE